MSAQRKEVSVPNPSGLSPLGFAVLVMPYEQQLPEGKIIIPEDVKAGMQQIDQRAVVVEVGPEAWKDEGQPRAVPGDRVLVAKYAGWVAGKGVTKDGRSYRVVNDRDIFCRIEG